MANTNAPFGLKYVRHQLGASNVVARPYYIPASYGTALFVGDPVVKTGTSNTARVRCSEGEFRDGELPAINKCTAGDGNAVTGVIVGFSINADNPNQKYNPASTERVALVIDDPYAIFQIQDDGGAALDETAVGLNAVFIFTDSGDTATGISGVELDAGTTDAPAADASNQMTILRLADRLNGDTGANAVWEVRLNNHTEAHGAVGI